MADPFIGEIRMFGGNFAPVDWAFCNGQLLQISEYDTLFTLIGTTYGGDGVNNFALPNLQGRLPMHVSPTYPLADSAGTETITLISPQLPSHSHTFLATTAVANQTTPNNGIPAAVPAGNIYFPTQGGAALAPQSIGQAGGNQPHDNMMPYLAVSFIISLFGIYPTQS